MLKNLQNVMSIKHISTKTIAALIDTTEKTARNKLDGVTDFTFDEAMIIAKNLFPEYELKYLFAREDQESA